MKIEEVKNKLGLNYTELSNMLGVSYATVHAWKTGRNDIPQYVKDLLDEKMSASMNIRLSEEAMEMLRRGKPVTIRKGGIYFKIERTE